MDSKLKLFEYESTKKIVKGRDIKRAILEIIDNKRILNSISKNRRKNVLFLYNKYMSPKATDYILDDHNYTIASTDSSNRLIIKHINPHTNNKKDTVEESISEYYYNQKYAPSNYNLSENNIVLQLNEDDIICLECGAIVDSSLSVVPKVDYHLSNYICPKCKSNDSTLGCYDKSSKKIIFFNRKKN